MTEREIDIDPLDAERWKTPSSGTAIQIVKADESALILTPRPELPGGGRQFGPETLVPHVSGIAPRGPKVLYTRDGVPTYVETIKCTACGNYFTLTFMDPKNRSSQCATCFRKGQQPVVVNRTIEIGPTKPPAAKSTSSASSTSTPSYTSKYSSYSGNYRWVSPSTEFDKFFASLGSFDAAKGSDEDDTDDSDNIEVAIARHKGSAATKSKSGKKKNKRERREERRRNRRERKRIHPDAY